MCDNPGAGADDKAAAVPDADAPSRVVGIGASAGGLEAVSELLRNLPSNTGMAFVFIQHLEPRQTSRLTEILSRITEMPVEVATDGLRMKQNHIYLRPSPLKNGSRFQPVPKDDGSSPHSTPDALAQT